MDPGSDQTDHIFLEALKYPPNEREAFVRSACENSAELCAAVLSLLGEIEANDSFLERPLGDRTLVASLLEASSWAHEPDDIIGAFRIVREIGRGGLGVVFLAERVEGGFDQRVALKVIRPGMDTAHVVRRFEMERSVLASFQHPNIAQLVDGGVTAHGRPYFAMEYIDGQSINAFCDDRNFDIQKRLALFRTVCNAVQYAHSNLVVHRDLKPSNVLVYEDEAGEPVVKLLDFGIAKILSADTQADLAANTTQTEIRAFTPGYAAPEQIRGLTPTVATDVYALGVVLYELLSGKKPFDTDGKSAYEIEQEILDTEPARPSTVLGASSSRDSLSALPKSIRRDLDMVVLKAIHREADRRYSSAEALATDVGNFLASRPVLARPDSVSYRSSRFIRRNILGVSLASLLVLALLAAVIGTSWQASVAKQERDGKALEADRANATLNFVLGVFESVNPTEAEGAPVTARTIVEAALEKLDGLEESPQTHAQMAAAVGQLSLSLGLMQVSDSLWSISLETRRNILAPGHPEIAESLLGKATAIGLTDPATAITLAEEALKIRTELYGPRDIRTLKAFSEVANNRYKNGQNEEAIEGYDQVVMMTSTQGDVSDEVRTLRAQVLSTRGTVLNALLRPDEAEISLTAAVEIQRNILGDNDPQTLYTMYSLAETKRKQNKFTEAETGHRELLPLMEKVFGSRSFMVGNSLMSLGFIARELGRTDDAVAAFDSVYVIYVETYGATHGYRAIPIAEKGEALFNAGKLDEAIPILREAISIYTKAYGSSYTRVLTAEIPLARALAQRGQFEDADRLLRHVGENLKDKPHRTDIAKELATASAELSKIRTQ